MIYAGRDHLAQGEHYLRHVEAMTAEGLHAKSAIAGELAARDIEIERLREDAELYRWLESRRGLDLRSVGGIWAREDGSKFQATHSLAEGGTQHAPMTDRELLEAAAKAAGYTLGRHSQDECKRTFGGKEWSPLTDDGDALRLAVKLGLTVDAAAHRASDGMGSWSAQAGERDGYAATRRAIVRAAAATAASK